MSFKFNYRLIYEEVAACDKQFPVSRAASEPSKPNFLGTDGTGQKCNSVNKVSSNIHNLAEPQISEFRLVVITNIGGQFHTVVKNLNPLRYFTRVINFNLQF